MKNVQDIFGSQVFNDAVMKERLPKATYKELRTSIETGADLTLDLANVIASEMKNWALEKGATHFTHWFQPMTGITAEKHDSFINPSDGGGVIMEFSGKELIKGEPDASSFPSGGIRATFEARGYTNWDPTSHAFIKEGTLCIPTAFCSYNGDALDKKTPLLRSMEALNSITVKLLHTIGMTDVNKITPTVGAEQEYFLVDEELYFKRKDLVYCGRTLFGARPPKRQELEDHYFGSIKPSVKAFMDDLNEELWKLGIFAKTQHNEVAPAQHELAPIFSGSNIATDHNQLTMEIMKKVAKRHKLACLLHEKPFAGVNGSGKHNNWSISTDTGVNLLDPGQSPESNNLFLLVLAAVVQAVDKYQDLLRVSVASPGNDHRLGGNEAPPAIISVFLGDELGAIVDSIISGEKYKGPNTTTMKIGVSALPTFQRDTTDRNRTSPFAFTGNKFEFRMPGSADSISCCNYIINTIVAEAFDEYNDKLSKAKNMDSAIKKLVKEVFTKHQRIIFNGDNYSEEWIKEAERRGLLNLVSSVDAFPYYIEQKNIDLFKKYHIFTYKEAFARYEIIVEEYSKLLNIEALTMLNMAKKEIAPAISAYSKELAETALAKKQLGISECVEVLQLTRISDLALSLNSKIDALDDAMIKVDDIVDPAELATYFRRDIFIKMQELRAVADELESHIGVEYWPFPTYGTLLFSVK